MREVTLPSGAVLKVQPAPFAEAKTLYQAILAELRGVPVSVTMDMAGLFKDLFCTSFASSRIEAAIKPCLARCLYNFGQGDLKVTDDCFEAVDRRQDYIIVLKEVAQDNTAPFVSSLFADYKTFLSMTETILGSASPKTI